MEVRKKINDLIKDNKKFFLQNQKLDGQILELEKCTRENKLSTNQLEQYNRSFFLVEFQVQTRRDVIELLKIVASNADIKGFEENQVDVAHRTSRRKTAPIIVKFVKKNDGINFLSPKEERLQP